MIFVEEAEKIIFSRVKSFGTENVAFEDALGRILAEDITADRDLPPYNRVTMDGIAVKYSAIEKGIRDFTITAIQAAGDTPVDIENENECIEIMTGAALPPTADTIIPYEQVDIKDRFAEIKQGVLVGKNQNIHPKGIDRKQHEVLVKAGTYLDATSINVAAAVGKTTVAVKKLPRVVIISTGDELVAVDETPLPYQVRRSNNYAIQAALAEYCIKPLLLHLPDEPGTIKQHLQNCLANFDVILLSGGVSMGKFDYVPQVLDELNLVKLFHKVRQRPGKPFWFGEHACGALVFAFPGNPVSTFCCLVRYFVPWLMRSLGVAESKLWAVLEREIACPPYLQYFLQVKLSISDRGILYAEPLTGNGSGDFSGLAMADAFMELPAGKGECKKGEVFRVWPFKRMFNAG